MMVLMPSELAEESDHDGHDQCFAECGIQQISSLFCDGGTDGLNLFLRQLAGLTICVEEMQRFSLPSFLYQPARALGNEKQRQ